MSRTLLLLPSKFLTITKIFILRGAPSNCPAGPKCHELSSAALDLLLLFILALAITGIIVVVTDSLSYSPLEPLRRLTGVGPFEDRQQNQVPTKGIEEGPDDY